RTTDGVTDWIHRRGAILNPTITVTDGLVCFVESRDPATIEHPLGRIPLDDLNGNAHLVALHETTGEIAWEVPLDLEGCRNIVYLAGRDGRLFLVGSQDAPDNDAAYYVRAFRTGSGDEIWRAAHRNLKPGELYHGEQVHHPVVLDHVLVAEPFIYDLDTGALRNPDDPIIRPGHSCGTMSGARDCLFFRAGNPTVLDLTTGEFTRLSPSRLGCWINVLPAQGLVLIPEASASCVCHYALQTSMAFRPR
ncbi:MAG: hypothetical protein KDA28_05020, partial [Phycisphaerales bacterium]|nr:hypothetical protein [Phycisphaerales bacterium]